jgi:DNA-binding transcriptional MerR regulator
MGLKQTSLFDFDFPETPIKPDKKKLSPPKEIFEAVPEPVEVDVTAVAPVVETRVKLNAASTEKKSTRGRMKISDMAATAELINIPDDEELFSKSYYSIGVVSDMFKVNLSLLRFWENEFDILKPRKNGKGDRLFRPEDVKNLRLIYHLLRERKYTIEGAKDFLKKSKHAEKKYELIASMKDLRNFLLQLKAEI